MPNSSKNLVVFLFFALALPNLSFSQDCSTEEIPYEVTRIYPPLSIAKETLIKAQTLTDLNEHYEASWVKEYQSVEVLATHRGKIKKAVGKNETLSQAQKDLMYGADIGTAISVKVEYLPKNNLAQNEVKESNFTFTIHPEIEASYIGGQEQLRQYVKDHAIAKIRVGSFQDYELTAVKFIISEEGEVTAPHVFETSKEEAIDALLLETVCNMPNWKPAEYANGLKVKQEFVLILGDMEKSCKINFLNIRRD